MPASSRPDATSDIYQWSSERDMALYIINGLYLGDLHRKLWMCLADLHLANEIKHCSSYNRGYIYANPAHLIRFRFKWEALLTAL